MANPRQGRVLAKIIAGLVALAVTGCAPGSGPGNTKQSLCADCNVILISFDTVRADHLSLYGYERATSPNLDAFARRAVVFENAISQSAWTLPAHASMMTGLYPERLGVVHYPAIRKLPVEADMLAEVFRKAGYATAGFTGGGFVSSHWGFDRGFDVYSTDGRRFEHNLDEAIAWLELNKTRPFFMFLHGYNAHRPYFSRRPDREEMGLDPEAPSSKKGFCGREPRERPSPETLSDLLKYYDGAIRHGDRQLGRFFRALRRLGVEDKTVVLVTSDHGEEFFEHGNCDHVRFLYNEVIRVPYVLRIPGFARRQQRRSDLIPASVSVPATLLDIVAIKHTMPGVSLLETIRGARNQFRAVYSHTSSAAGRLGSRGETAAIVTAGQKLVSYLEEGTDEAYDLVDDPGERKILAEGHAAYGTRASLKAWLAGQVRLSGPQSKFVGKQRGNRRERMEAAEEETEVPEELRKNLRSLGYLE